MSPNWRRRPWRRATLCGLVILFGVWEASAQVEHKRVLLLYDEDRNLPGLAILDRSLRSRLQEELGIGIEYFTESMNVSQFSDARHQEVLRDYYSSKYRGRQPDLVIGVMGPALAFLVRYGNDAFPGVPIVFCGADAADLEGKVLLPHVTGLLVKRVFAPTVDVLLTLQPDTRQVFVVGGTSAFDRHLLAQARDEFRAFDGRVSFTYLTDLPMNELLVQVSRLPAHSAVAFVGLFRDGAGRAHVPHDVVSRISDAANAPLYVFVDQYLDRGPVGGHLYSLEQHGKSTADVAVRVLRGEPAAAIPVRELSSTANMFDARQLVRWRLDERRLPSDSVVRFRELGLWDRYRSYVILGALLLIAQAALIAALLIHRARRRRAEVELRSSYERIRNLGGRLLTAQEAERAHLARELHDDIAQQLGLLQIELQSLLTTDEDETRWDGLAEASARATSIGRSLHDLSHRLHPAQLRLVGLSAALEALKLEMSTPGVSISFAHEQVPDVLSSDVTVCLYRVAQEALSNAIKHSRADRISIRLVGVRDRLTVTIEDNGVGFNPRTAPPGLGLISMTERVEQVGGTLRLQSTPGQGSRIEATVVCSTDNTAAEAVSSVVQERPTLM